MLKKPKQKSSALTLAACCLAGSAQAANAAVLVDVNQEDGRRDTLTPQALNWQVKLTPAAEFDLGNGAKASLKTLDGKGQVQGVLWKGGIDTGSTMATDGVVATEGGTLLLTITGLAPGKHTLATFHNTTEAKPTEPLPILVQNAGLLDKRLPEPVKPTYRVDHDDDAASVFFEFTGTGVTISVAPAQAGAMAILSGFELDGFNPKLRATHLSPTDGDEHAPDKPELKWNAGANAVAHRVYFGESREAVLKAEKPSNTIAFSGVIRLPVTPPEFQGEQVTTSYKVPVNLDHMKTYYWRVDEVQKDGTVTPGRLARLRIRQLAFPGAEGYGRFARGGRGGRVIEVTNLDDSGPGSLRAAVEAEGPRTVVFRVGGTIKLKSRLVVKNPYITIAGQTAPGDGIAVRDATFGLSGAHDTIMRYIRIRIGDESGKTFDGTGFGASNHAIIDHCSIAWSIDEGVSGRGAKNITFQRNLLTEPLHVSIHDHYGGGGKPPGTTKGHGFSGSISGDIGSFHHNLLANCAGRNWSLAGGFTQGGKFGGNVDIRNNVVYNWYHRTNDGGVRRLNLVNNYYIPGAATQVFHLLVAEIELPLDHDFQSYYVSGNRMEGRPQYDADNWKNGGVTFKEKDLVTIKSEKPFYPSYVTPHTALEGYASVMADVGANIPHYDPVDQRAIQTTLNRTTVIKGGISGIPGIPDSQKDVGGYPEMKNGTAPADNDHDGMADWWEKERGLNPAGPEDRNIVGAGGYTNLEQYLNWIVDNGGLEKKATTISRAQQAELAVLLTGAKDVTGQLQLADTARADRVTRLLEEQYKGLFAVLTERENKIHNYENMAGGEKDFGGKTHGGVVTEAFAEAKPKLAALHTRFLGEVSAVLSPAEVIRLKDAMTDNRMPEIYRNFNEMFPNLKPEEKKQILAWLETARESAMDTVTKRQRKQWFDKYIGMSNNYIAKQGHDFKRLAQEWADRTGDSDGP